MLGADEFPLPLPFEVVAVRILRPGDPQPTETDRVRARRVAFDLRFEIERFNREAIIAAERIAEALSGEAPLEFRRTDSLPPQRSLEALIRQIESELQSRCSMMCPQRRPRRRLRALPICKRCSSLDGARCGRASPHRFR